MPCDSISTQSVNLANAIPELVFESMKACGWNVRQETKALIQAWIGQSRIIWTAGQGITVSGSNSQFFIAALTKQYSVKAVDWAAQRAGWTVKQTATDKLTVTRR